MYKTLVNYYLYFVNYKNIPIIFILCLLACATLAQQTDSTQTKQSYRVHTVQAGETLYGIAKRYNISKETLNQNNPDIKAGLKAGQILVIPREEKEKTGNTEIKEGFRSHTVIKGETLYSLSKRYRVSQETIIKHNPFLEEGLKPEQMLQIPPPPPLPVSEQYEVLKQEVLLHQVQKKETFYALQKKYGVTKKELIRLNPVLKEGLKDGQLIQIPVAPTESTFDKNRNPETALAPTDSLKKKNLYQVALFLPFYLSDTLQDIKHSRLAFDFYTGAQTAVDSLVKQGMSVKLHVFDTKNDAAHTDSLAGLKHLKEIDLAIGPLYSQSNYKVADKLGAYHIPVISPLSRQTNVEARHNLIRTVPSSLEELKAIKRSIHEHHRSDPVLIIARDTSSDAACLRYLSGALLAEDTNRSVKNVLVKEKLINPKKLKLLLKPGQKQVILVPSKEKVFVTDLMTQLNALADTNVYVYGLSKWERFNIDNDYLVNLHFRMPFYYYVDHENDTTDAFIRKYRERYKTEPSSYAYQGFDVSWYFLNLLHQFGSVRAGISLEKSKGVHTSFDFRKTRDGGYKNRSIYMLRYGDYELTRE